MDARNGRVDDAGEWRAFVLRRPLRELVEKSGTAETPEAPGPTPGRRWPAGSSCAGRAGRTPWGVVELADMAAVSAGADRAAWRLTVTLAMLSASGQQA